MKITCDCGNSFRTSIRNEEIPLYCAKCGREIVQGLRVEPRHERYDYAQKDGSGGKIPVHRVG